jgi:riboflavin synthase
MLWSMFTGIIEGVGDVISLERSATGRRLRVRASGILDQVQQGDSVAVDGCCLTASALDGPTVGFDVVPATLARSTLGTLRPGARVNLERALPLGGRLDGHLVQGHVDGIAVVRDIQQSRDEGWRVTLEPEDSPDPLTPWMIPQGSVAVAGVSLTIAALEPPHFTVALVPTTRQLTTLGEGFQPGQRVNIEVDLIGKYVRRTLEAMGLGTSPPGLSADLLREAGYLDGDD